MCMKLHLEALCLASEPINLHGFCGSGFKVLYGVPSRGICTLDLPSAIEIANKVRVSIIVCWNLLVPGPDSFCFVPFTF